jgi:hypothetical protein
MKEMNGKFFARDQVVSSVQVAGFRYSWRIHVIKAAAGRLAY